MTADLSGATSGAVERFVPDRDRGRLIEAEHVVRYRWAAQAATGRTVLDAGCGTGYGSSLLARAGAAEVIGVDIAESLLESLAPSIPGTVHLEVGDLRHLAHEDDRFELIVCFEVIQYVDDPAAVLDEFTRVLAPGGLLLISSPNAGVAFGDDAHRPGPRGAVLREMLEARLGHVRLMRQHDYVVSAVLSDRGYTVDGAEALSGLSLDKLVSGAPDDELYTVAIAGDEPVPELGELGAMTGPLELAGWLAAADRQDEAIRTRDDRLAELGARVAERDEIARLLTDAEQRAAAIPALRERIEDLERELIAINGVLEQSRAENQHLDERLMSSERAIRDVFSSPSWQVTKPLRYAKRRLRG